VLRATPHTRLRACYHSYTSSTVIDGKGGAGPSSLHTSLEEPTEYVNAIWMLKSTWIDSYMALNGSCLKITWIVFKKHLLEVDLTQNWETMELQMLTTVDLLYFIMCEASHGEEFNEIAFG
jgi:hypothetical protein